MTAALAEEQYGCDTAAVALAAGSTFAALAQYEDTIRMLEHGKPCVSWPRFKLLLNGDEGQADALQMHLAKATAWQPGAGHPLCCSMDGSSESRLEDVNGSCGVPIYTNANAITVATFGPCLARDS